jgi:DNA-directed RNA polymerase specialized sigma24 family protein
MNDDAQLLRRYVDYRAEDAFTELVRRHVRLVYSCALRSVGHDAHLAEDVTQMVFTDLARKAPSLTERPTLGPRNTRNTPKGPSEEGSRSRK